MTTRRDPHLLSGAYSLDAVTPDEAAAVEEAMAHSEELRGEIAELTDTAVLLGMSVPAADPPPALRARLLDLIEQTPQLPPLADTEVEADAERAVPIAAEQPAPAPGVAVLRSDSRHVAPRRRRRWTRGPALLAGALVAAAAVLFGGGMMLDQLVNPAPQSTSASAFDQLRSARDVQRQTASVAGGGTAVVYWSKSLDESAVVLDGVAQPAGKSLQMWVVTGGRAASAGLYAPRGGERYELMKGALKPDQAVAVSVEPAGGSSQPTTKPIVVVPVAA
ncbi:anti-sigma factor [Amnibacterium sp. CER49]|uniref:anti-sigma factor n=1 Tax=Amnibacterium sp. CER49 TaxID=3039161 RepID=UPI00244B5E3E|nr:anti-sigma factor [Amnibacterium sp. CER49]MDH2444114.1 anti-sigma factor [Amnibacterium sp. CER49]